MPRARPPRPLPPPPVPGRDDSPENLQRMRDDLVEHFVRMGEQIRSKNAAWQARQAAGAETSPPSLASTVVPPDPSL
ncbi:hypothetical protein ACIQC9_12030 [Brevundimonas sp. NPDC092305]|uniref:hypothetical protein n=1 Tax=Brevundimonas sp. NPDC092305 TaxID=3363957 RepID=UPI003817BDF0